MSYEPPGFSRKFGNKHENISSRLHSSVSNGDKSAVNGVVGSFGRQDESNERRNYKLLIDPAIKKGHQKIYRFDGVFPGQPPVVPKDPRSRRTRIWKQIKADLPVPNFKVDKNYVGIPPQREVLFTGLNDNVDKRFLQEMCERYGKIENIKIYYDPLTKKHSGKGRVTLSTTSAAKMVMAKLDSTSVMGNIIRATLEPNLKGLKNVTKLHRGEHTFTRRGSNEDESIAPGRQIPPVASKFLTHLPTPPCSINSQSPSTENSVSTPTMLVDPRLDNLSTLKPPPPPPPRMTDVSPDCASLWDKTSLNLKLLQSSSFISPQSTMSSSASFEPISPPPAPLRTKDTPPPPPPGRPPSPPDKASVTSQQSHDEARSGSAYMNFEDISPDPVFSPEENSKLGKQEHSTHQMKTETKPASKDKSDKGNIDRLIESCRRNSSRSMDNKGRSPKSDSSWSRERKFYSERDDRRDRYRDKERSSDGWDQERSERNHGYSPRERRFDKHSDFKGGNRHRNYRWNDRRDDRRDDRREDYKKYDKRDDYDRNRQHRRDRYSTSPRQVEDRSLKSENLEASHRDKVNDSKNKEQEVESRNSYHLYQDAGEHVMNMNQPEMHRTSNNESTVRAEASVPLYEGSLYTPTQTMQNHCGGNLSSSESSNVTNVAEIISLVVSGAPQAEAKVTSFYDGDAYTVGIEACSDEEPLPPGDEGDVADKVNKERSRNKLKAAQDNIKKRKYSTETGEEKQENSVKAKKQIQIVVKSRRLSATAEPGLSLSGSLETTCKDDDYDDDDGDCSDHFRGGWRTVSLDQPYELESNNLLDEISDEEGLDMAGNLPVVEDISPCPSPSSDQMTECMVTTVEAVVKTSEETASTQLYSDIEANDDSGAGGNDDNDVVDDDDAMSLSSISSNEDTFQVNEPVKKMSPRRKQIPVSVPPPRIPFPPYPPPPSFNLSVPPPAPFNPMFPPPLFGPVTVPPPPLHPVGVPPPALCPPSSLSLVPPPSIPPPSVTPITVPPPPIHPANVPPPHIHPSAVPRITIPPPIVPPVVPPPTGPPHIPPPPMRNPGFYDCVSMPHYPNRGSKYQETAPPPPPPKKTWKGIMTENVYSAVSSELEKMVNRDVFRKLIETSAFKALEAWWDNQTKPKESMSPLAMATPGTHPLHPHAPSTIGQPSNMSSTPSMLGPSPFERQHSMVIGIKASLPKLPSFKVKRTLQPPKHEELVTSSHQQSVADSPVSHERANKRRCLDDSEVDTDLESSRGTERRQRTTSRMEEEERSESPWQHLDDSMDAAPPATRVRSNRDIVEAGRRTSTGSSLYHTVYSSSEGSDGEEESESAVSESEESEAEGSAVESEEEESEAETEEESDEESDEEMKREEPAPTHKDEEPDKCGSFTRNLSSTSISPRPTEGIQRTVETVTLSERTNYQAQRAAAIDDVANAAWFVRPALHAEVTTMVESREQETEIIKEQRETVETTSVGDTEGISTEKEAVQNSSKLDELVRSGDTVYSPPRVAVQGEAVRVDHESTSEDAELDAVSDNDEVFIEGSTSDLSRSTLRAVSLVELDHPYGMSASEDERAYKEEPTTTPHQQEPSVEAEWEDTAVCKPAKTVHSPIIDVENGIADPLFLPVKPEEIIPPEPIVVKPSFPLRRYEEDDELVYEMIRSGIDNEDARYLKIGFERLLQVGSESVLDAHWSYHPVCPPQSNNTISWKRRKQRLEHGVRVHASGCARTEGYYKLNMNEKARYLETARRQLQVQENLPDEQQKIDGSKAKQQSREHRLVQRRLQLAVIKEDYGDLLKFNQLRVRKKQLKFAKSGIHDWGLFALEPIAADEMVIEYVGEMIRQPVADLRERRYEDMGIGSSYMFRVDLETIIDATTLGNLARFINHCCDPNCYARIISVENNKKIVIYSKRDIQVNEEITYDYKFPIEEEKIPCLCGVPQCRGTLN